MNTKGTKLIKWKKNAETENDTVNLYYIYKVVREIFTYAWFLHLACHHRKLHGHSAMYCHMRRLVHREPLKGPKEANC